MPKLAVDSNLRRLPMNDDEGIAFGPLMTLLFSQQPTHARRAVGRVFKQLEAQVGREANRDSRVCIDSSKVIKAEMKQEIREIFNKYDADGNGEISRQEFREALPDLNAVMSDPDHIFDICSDNRDTIQFEQFLELMLEARLPSLQITTSHGVDEDVSRRLCCAKANETQRDMKKRGMGVLHMPVPAENGKHGNQRSLKLRQRLQTMNVHQAGPPFKPMNIPPCGESAHASEIRRSDEQEEENKEEDLKGQVRFRTIQARYERRKEKRKGN